MCRDRNLRFIQRAMDSRPQRLAVHDLQLLNDSIDEELFAARQKRHRFPQLEMETGRMRTASFQCGCLSQYSPW